MSRLANTMRRSASVGAPRTDRVIQLLSAVALGASETHTLPGADPDRAQEHLPMWHHFASALGWRL